MIADQVSDLGGADMISSAEMILIRRAAMMCLQAELQEQSWAENGGEASPRQLDGYARNASSLRRILESLGLRRRPRDVTPSLGEYLAHQPDRDTEDAEVCDG